MEVSNNSSGNRSKSSGFTRIQVAAIVLSDVVGICLIAFVFFYFYRRIIASKGKQSLAITKKGLKEKRDCMCFKKDESETISENTEHVDLVSLDPHVSFNLDELLKASAFVLGKSEVGTLYKVV
ncbi:hypothetical protein HPP92_009462 [Vanilla planifolia]|nr:hypothetical protein HPP92_009462 [Vanilla planifolia]